MKGLTTIIVLAILALIFFTRLNKIRFNNEFMTYQLRALQHANTQHILANGISFLGLMGLENMLGSTYYALAIVFVTILSSLLLYIYHHVFPSRKVPTVGFSGAVFGLIVIYLACASNNLKVSMIGLTVSILPQLFIQGISWEGHLCGILAGLIFVIMFNPKKRIQHQNESLQSLS